MQSPRNLVCQSGNLAVDIKSDLSQMFCSNTNCRCKYSKMSSCLHTIQINQLKSNIEQKRNSTWKGYQRVINFYNYSIKCLESDKNRLIQKMNNSQGPGLNLLDNLALLSLQPSNTKISLNQQYQTIKQSQLSNLLIKTDNLFSNFNESLRGLWCYDKQDCIQQITKIKGQIAQLSLKNDIQQTKYTLFNPNQTVFSLHSLKQIQILNSDYKLICQLLFLAPQIQGISISINLQKISQNCFKIIDSIHKFVNLKSLQLTIQSSSNSQYPFKSYLQKKLYGTITQLISKINLQKLIINGFQLLEQTIQTILILKNIKHFTISSTYSNKSSFGRYQTNQIQIISLEKVQKILNQGFNNLTYLNLSKTQVSNNIFNILKKFTKLQKLFLKHNIIKDMFLESFLPSLLNLKVLQLKLVQRYQTVQQTQGITWKGIQSLTRYNKQLKQLNLNNHQIGDKGAMLISTHLHKLQILSLINCKLSNTGCLFISKLKNIKTIHIGFSYTPFSNRILLNIPNINEFIINIQSINPYIAKYKTLKNDTLLIQKTQMNRFPIQIDQFQTDCKLQCFNDKSIELLLQKRKAQKINLTTQSALLEFKINYPENKYTYTNDLNSLR